MLFDDGIDFNKQGTHVIGERWVNLTNKTHKQNRRQDGQPLFVCVCYQSMNEKDES